MTSSDSEHEFSEAESNDLENTNPNESVDALTLPRTCMDCGVVVRNSRAMQIHQRAHKRTNGFKCSICGIQTTSFTSRNKHEKKLHGFRRQTGHNERGIVRIRQHQLIDIFNVGFKLVHVQENGILDKREPGEATKSEIENLQKVNPSVPSFDAIPCPYCGRNDFPSRNKRNLHDSGHKYDGLYVCSCCGIQKITAKLRNEHEKEDHKYDRGKFNYERKEAMMINMRTKETLKNLGPTNYEQIQNTAEIPWTVEGGPRYSLRKRKLAPPIIDTSSESELSDAPTEDIGPVILNFKLQISPTDSNAHS
ncbi:hypothetical protein M3Y96_00991600 [Aphelenchoides besseyi]|nr:hypothetical protein M3Y96_00991600 [Aphelenchoides besseyi]